MRAGYAIERVAFEQQAERVMAQLKHCVEAAGSHDAARSPVDQESISSLGAAFIVSLSGIDCELQLTIRST